MTVFRFLEAHFGEGLVEVIWDRRLEGRRTARTSALDERRRQERRSAPPDTWHALGFILVRREAP